MIRKRIKALPKTQPVLFTDKTTFVIWRERKTSLFCLLRCQYILNLDTRCGGFRYHQLSKSPDFESFPLDTHLKAALVLGLFDAHHYAAMYCGQWTQITTWSLFDKHVRITLWWWSWRHWLVLACRISSPNNETTSSAQCRPWNPVCSQ